MLRFLRGGRSLRSAEVVDTAWSLSERLYLYGPSIVGLVLPGLTALGFGWWSAAQVAAPFAVGFGLIIAAVCRCWWIVERNRKSDGKALLAVKSMAPATPPSKEPEKTVIESDEDRRAKTRLIVFMRKHLEPCFGQQTEALSHVSWQIAGLIQPQSVVRFVMKDLFSEWVNPARHTKILELFPADVSGVSFRELEQSLISTRAYYVQGSERLQSLLEVAELDINPSHRSLAAWREAHRTMREAWSDLASDPHLSTVYGAIENRENAWGHIPARITPDGFL